MDKVKAKKIANIALNILLYIFLAICIFAVCLTLFSRRGADGSVEVFGHEMRVVTSESMAKCELTDVSDYKIKDIPLRSMVFVKLIPEDPVKANEWYGELEVGDVLTFRYVYATQVTITHRITSITEKEGGYIIELAGDNKNTKDGQLVQTIDTSIPNNTNYVIGKVVGQARVFGAVMSFLMKPMGILLVIIVPCFFIMLLEVIKIVKVLDSDKKSREEEEKAKKEAELESLRRRISELEKDKADKPSDEGSET